MASTDSDGDSFAIFATAFSEACLVNPSITSAETASRAAPEINKAAGIFTVEPS